VPWECRRITPQNATPKPWHGRSL